MGVSFESNTPALTGVGNPVNSSIKVMVTLWGIAAERSRVLEEAGSCAFAVCMADAEMSNIKIIIVSRHEEIAIDVL